MIARVASGILSAFLSLYAETGTLPVLPLDTAVLRESFTAGKREELRRSLESLMRSPIPLSPADRGECLRFLSAIYADEPGAGSKASSHMYQLLRLQPERTALNLPVAAATDAVFERIRAEFIAGRAEEREPSPYAGAKPMGSGLRWAAGSAVLLAVVAFVLAEAGP
jgi:hypothetical protein